MTAALAKHLRRLRRVRREDGMTMVEVVVALLVVTIGGLAVLGAVDAASRNTFRAQQSQVVNDRLQAEIEQLKQLPYSQLALKTPLPTHVDVPTNPNYRITTSIPAQFNLNRGGDPNYEDLVYNGGVNHDQGQTTPVSGGVVDPGGPSSASSSFNSGGVTGTIYRYVTWQQDQACGNCGQPYLKHLTVIVALGTTASGGVRAYHELQADVANPNAQTNAGGPPPGPSNPTPWTFWLTDTPCDGTSSQQRQNIAGPHATHNTRGACNPTGATTGNVPGPPDLMYTQTTPCANNDCTTQQDLYDYATDVEPLNKSGADKGLQLEPGPACGGLQSTWNSLPLVPDTPDPNYFQKVHKWLAPPVPTGFNGGQGVVLNGQGALNLWTKTINGAIQPGKVCVYLFYRQVAQPPPPPAPPAPPAPPVVTDVPVVSLDPNAPGVSYFTFSCPTDGSNAKCQAGWPASWQELHIPLQFNVGANLTPGTQLGVALSVDNTGTGNGGLEFLYDAPSYDSRLQVETTSTLPF